MASVVAARGDLTASRSTDEGTARPTLGAPRTLAKRQSMEGAASASSRGSKEDENACNLHRCVGELGSPRRVVELGGAGARRRHSNRCRVRPDSRSGALASVSLPALVVAASPASSLVVLTPKGGPGGASARSAQPTTTAERVSRSTAAMKLARASASLMLRGSST
jgi:hypothetical protein